MRRDHSAGAVIVHPGPQRRHYLLAHYHAGHWDLVKGHVEEGESIEQTVRREVREEVGLDDLRLDPTFRERIDYRFWGGDGVVLKRVDVLLAETATWDVQVCEPRELADVGWYAIDDARRVATFASGRRVLDAAHAHLLGQRQARLDAWVDGLAEA